MAILDRFAELAETATYPVAFFRDEAGRYKMTNVDGDSLVRASRLPTKPRFIGVVGVIDDSPCVRLADEVPSEVTPELAELYVRHVLDCRLGEVLARVPA